MRKSTCLWTFALAILLSLGLVAMVGCESGSSSDNDNGGTNVVNNGGNNNNVGVLASGSATITGGGHKLATVTAPTKGTLRWAITRVAGGDGIIGLSVDIMQGAASLAHDATQDATVDCQTAVTAGQSYDLMASTSDTDVSITYLAQMQ